ncbi:hypothetical protein [Nocardia sp. SYP-A9097]|nr:hypothetical protein [Nocardia sp. SYP-A9097]
MTIAVFFGAGSFLVNLIANGPRAYGNLRKGWYAGLRMIKRR